MSRKIKIQLVFLYLFLILSATGFTACRHRHKVTDHPIVNEMPLPNADNYYYSPVTPEKEVVSNNEQIFTVKLNITFTPSKYLHFEQFNDDFIPKIQSSSLNIASHFYNIQSI